MALRWPARLSWRRWDTPAAALFRWRNASMLKRQLAIAAVVATILISAGCSCCHKSAVVSNAPPCCGAPVGAVAVPAAPAPVAAGFAPAAPCPTCVGR